MTTANSNFEEWLLHNPDKTIDDYTFDFKKCRQVALYLI